MKAIDPAVHLSRRLAEANVSVSTDVLEKVLGYFRLLSTWNRRINLTGFDLNTPSPAAIDRLLVEPLAAAAQMLRPVTHLLDIGSGGGSPGIPVALALHGPRLTLVETRFRKAIFLKEALRVTQLDGGQVVTSRYEDLTCHSELVCDALTARAVRLDQAAVKDLGSLVRRGGHMYLFRSDDSMDLIRSLPRSLRHVETRPLLSSRAGSESQLVVVEKV